MADGTERGLVPVDAATVKAWLAADEAVLVDVRERKEYDAGHLPGSVLLPLSSFDVAKLPATNGRKLVLHCQSGVRATDAAQRVLNSGAETVYCFRGGMAEWQAAGYPVEGGSSTAGGGSGSVFASGRSASGRTVQEQTLLAVGTMVLVFTLLGTLVHPKLGWLNLLPGLGLINAGATGRCPLALAVAKAPWNR